MPAGSHESRRRRKRSTARQRPAGTMCATVSPCRAIATVSPHSTRRRSSAHRALASVEVTSCMDRSNRLIRQVDIGITAPASRATFAGSPGWAMRSRSAAVTLRAVGFLRREWRGNDRIRRAGSVSCPSTRGRCPTLRGSTFRPMRSGKKDPLDRPAPEAA